MTQETVDAARPPVAEVARSERFARWAVALLFFANGLAGGSWFVRIPAVQQALGLGNGALGLALLATAVGAMVSMPAAGWLSGRLGSRPVTIVMSFALCIALPLPTLAPDFPWLVAALFLLGIAYGGMDVAMNAQAVAVERRYRRPILTSFHALFSIGGMVGAVIGGFVAGQGVAPSAHLAGLALVLAAGVAAMVPLLLREPPETVGQPVRFVMPGPALLALGVVAMCVLIGEGAMADWSAVYLRQVLDTTPGMAAAGYAVFSLTMAAGRLSGDAIAARFGPVRVVQAGGLIAGLGLTLGLAVQHPTAAMLGFAAVGAGLACAFPLVVSAASRTPGMSAGAAIGAVSTAGYAGFLLGPPIIGLSAELVGLRAALGLIVVLALIAAALAKALDR